MRALAVILLAIISLCAARASAPEPLTTAAAVRALSYEEAGQHRPVRLRATVTLIDPGRTVFLQDSTGGTFIRSGLSKFALEPGDELLVEGVTYPGLYVPGIDVGKVQVLGRAPLPPPVDVTLEELASGHRHYERVATTGIVRAIHAADGRSVMVLSSGDGRLEAHVPDDLVADRLVDAVVTVSGLAAGFINDKRQMVAPHLRMRSAADIIVRVPPPSDPFSIAPIKAEDLLRFSPQQRPGHRRKLRGVVTLHEPGRALYIRDGKAGVLVETQQEAHLTPGDDVEVLGFPAMGRFSAYLQDGAFRILGNGEIPNARTASARELLRGARDADLVRVEGQLVRVIPAAGVLTLLMQDGEVLFRCRVPDGDRLASKLRIGSTLQLTGVCQVSEVFTRPVGFRSEPRAFEILLGSPTDLIVLRAPSWWTPRRLAIFAAILLGLTAMALLWVALLRFQVRRQTTLLAEKVQAEAVAEERQRLAREFHDTLEQELVGLTLRLDAMATRISDRKPLDLLHAARRLVQRIQCEARMLVWDLRERASEREDLPGAILEATRAIGSAATLDISVTGDPQTLPGVTQHHLVRIAQESVTNAIKHGHASRIQIRLIFTAHALAMEIEDNGAGFDATSAASRPGHFGIIGMHERARKADGSLKIRSTPGRGTTLQMTVPVSEGTEQSAPKP